MALAKRLDGKVVAEEIRESLKPRVARFSTAAGRPPGLGILLAGDDGGSEIYVRNKVRACEALGIRADLQRLPVEADPRRGDGDRGAVQRGRRHRRRARAVPAAGGHGGRRRAAGLRRHRSRQGRRRLQPRQRRPAGPEPSGAGAGHAFRHHRAARAERHPHRGAPRRRHRPQRHRRQAHGRLAAAPPRDGDHLPFADPRPARGGVVGRHPGGGHRAAGLRDRGLREAGRHGDRRGHLANDRPGPRGGAVRAGLSAPRGARAAGRHRRRRRAPRSRLRSRGR